jgi:HAD superfamily hydrolase (TIGR01549 family)
VGTETVEALSFDLDGTLLDGAPWRDVINRTCDEIAAAHPGLEAGRLVEANAAVWDSYWPQVEDQWTLGSLDGRAVTLEAWRRTLQACGLDDESTVLRATETYLRNRRAGLHLFDDVREMFSAVRPRPIALVTNGASDTQRGALRALGVEPEFAVIVVSGEVGLAKPDPAIFRFALDRLGVSPAKAWHIGDNLTTDVAGAQSAGLTAVWLNRSGARRSDGDPEPNREIRSLNELPLLIAARS